MQNQLPDEAPLVCTCGKDVCSGYTSPCGPGRVCCCESRCTCQSRVLYSHDAAQRDERKDCCKVEVDPESGRRHCSYCVPERVALNELDYLAAQYRNRMQRNQRRDMMHRLIGRQYASGQGYNDNNASLLRGSQGSAYQQAVQREQLQRRQQLQGELCARRRRGVELEASSAGVDCSCCSRRPHISSSPHPKGCHTEVKPKRSATATASGPKCGVQEPCGCSCTPVQFYSCQRDLSGKHQPYSKCTPCKVEVHCVQQPSVSCSPQPPGATDREPVRHVRAPPSSAHAEKRSVGVSSTPPPPSAGGRKTCPGCGWAGMQRAVSCKKVPAAEQRWEDAWSCPSCGLWMGVPPSCCTATAAHPRSRSCFTSDPTRRPAAKSSPFSLQHGRKVFVTDDDYLQRRSQYMDDWEKAGLVVPVQPSGKNRLHAPLTESTARWKTVKRSE